jgi:hypothetical protein
MSVLLENWLLSCPCDSIRNGWYLRAGNLLLVQRMTFECAESGLHSANTFRDYHAEISFENCGRSCSSGLGEGAGGREGRAAIGREIRLRFAQSAPANCLLNDAVLVRRVSLERRTLCRSVESWKFSRAETRLNQK